MSQKLVQRTASLAHVVENVHGHGPWKYHAYPGSYQCTICGAEFTERLLEIAGPAKVREMLPQCRGR